MTELTTFKNGMGTAINPAVIRRVMDCGNGEENRRRRHHHKSFFRSFTQSQIIKLLRNLHMHRNVGYYTDLSDSIGLAALIFARIVAYRTLFRVFNVHHVLKIFIFIRHSIFSFTFCFNHIAGDACDKLSVTQLYVYCTSYPCVTYRPIDLPCIVEAWIDQSDNADRRTL